MIRSALRTYSVNPSKLDPGSSNFRQLGYCLSDFRRVHRICTALRLTGNTRTSAANDLLVRPRPTTQCDPAAQPFQHASWFSTPFTTTSLLGSRAGSSDQVAGDACRATHPNATPSPRRSPSPEPEAASMPPGSSDPRMRSAGPPERPSRALAWSCQELEPVSPSDSGLGRSSRPGRRHPPTGSRGVRDEQFASGGRSRPLCRRRR